MSQRSEVSPENYGDVVALYGDLLLSPNRQG